MRRLQGIGGCARSGADCKRTRNCHDRCHLFCFSLFLSVPVKHNRISWCDVFLPFFLSFSFLIILSKSTWLCRVLVRQFFSFEIDQQGLIVVYTGRSWKLHMAKSMSELMFVVKWHFSLQISKAHSQNYLYWLVCLNINNNRKRFIQNVINGTFDY